MHKHGQTDMAEKFTITQTIQKGGIDNTSALANPTHTSGQQRY